MKVLTVLQPLAWAIVAGHKQVENRTWSTPHRGLLLIHAGKSRALLRAYRGRKHLDDQGTIALPDLSALPLGCIVGAVRLVDCLTARQAAHRRLAFVAGPLCWHLTDAVAFASPIPVRGQLGLWRLPAVLEEAVQGQLAASMCAPSPGRPSAW
jgi:hypothetical protein